MVFYFPSNHIEVSISTEKKIYKVLTSCNVLAFCAVVRVHVSTAQTVFRIYRGPENGVKSKFCNEEVINLKVPKYNRIQNHIISNINGLIIEKYK